MRSEFAARIEEVVTQQQNDFKTYLTGVLSDYGNARKLKDQAQASYNTIAAAAADAQATVNLINTFLGLFSSYSLQDIVNDPSKGGVLSDALSAAFSGLVRLINTAQNLQSEIQKQTQRQAGAEGLLATYFSSTQRDTYYTSIGNGTSQATAATAVMNASTAVQINLATIASGLRAAGQVTLDKIDATVTAIQKLSNPGSDLLGAVNAALYGAGFAHHPS